MMINESVDSLKTHRYSLVTNYSLLFPYCDLTQELSKTLLPLCPMCLCGSFKSSNIQLIQQKHYARSH